MRFSEIPGLSNIKEKLVRAIETGKVAHAQMFSGPEGSGNLTLALAYATMLNCTNPKNGDSCGECPSCRKTDKLIHPDVHFVFPVSNVKQTSSDNVVSDTYIGEWRKFVGQNPYGSSMEWAITFAAENKQLNISREESRNIVRKLSLKSYESKYKIMIIWLAEYLHPSAANALLKLLEEPPENTVFLLVTYDSEQIIGTILSRVQLVKIRAFNNPEVEGYLTDQPGVAADKASFIATMASGNLNQARKLLDDDETGTSAFFQEWMRICFMCAYDRMVQTAENFANSSKINQKAMFQFGMTIVRDALLTQNGADALIHGANAEKKFASDFSKAMKLVQLEKLYGLFNQANYHLERNCNPKITFLDTSLLISETFRKK